MEWRFSFEYNNVINRPSLVLILSQMNNVYALNTLYLKSVLILSLFLLLYFPDYLPFFGYSPQVLYWVTSHNPPMTLSCMWS
jgi:hypothetical protein